MNIKSVGFNGNGKDELVLDNAPSNPESNSLTLTSDGAKMLFLIGTGTFNIAISDIDGTNMIQLTQDGGGHPDMQNKSSYPGTIDGNITFDLYPVDVEIMPNKNYAYVTLDDSVQGTENGELAIIRLSDRTIVNRTVIGDSMGDIHINPAGTYAYVASFYSHTITIVRISDNTIVNTIDSSICGTYPTEMVFSPDGSKMWVSNHYGWKVTVLDMTDPVNPTQITTVSTSNEAIGLDMTPDGQYVYVIARYNGSVDVIRTSDYTNIKTINIGSSGDVGGSRGVSVTNDGAYVYATHLSDGILAMIQTSDNTVVNSIDYDGEIWETKITSDGNYLFVGVNWDILQPYSYLKIIRVSDNTEVDSIYNGTNFIKGISIASDNSFAIFTSWQDKKLIFLTK